mmetsp:Transcript_28130/g.73748  ORF Transcript_28130/g.73748 Transcript_28130/m.73748 type:complete len:101 (+) Transcript_28130:589-891(+)
MVMLQQILQPSLMIENLCSSILPSSGRKRRCEHAVGTIITLATDTSSEHTTITARAVIVATLTVLYFDHTYGRKSPLKAVTEKFFVCSGVGGTRAAHERR